MNRYSLGNNGRPPVYATEEELNSKIGEYFEYCIENKEKATITGMALYLGFCSRQSMYDYESRDQFSYIIKRARLAVENSYECSGQTIDIFCLKNMGWSDRTALDVTTDLSSLGEDQLRYIANQLIKQQHEK